MSAANSRLPALFFGHGSPIIASHKIGDPRVQDPYSIRCMPQVHGASRDALAYTRKGDNANAVAAFTRYVTLAPNSEDAVQIKNAIRQLQRR